MSGPRHSAGRAVVLVLGLLLPQFWLLGPALIGQKVMLPLDLLGTRQLFNPDRADLQFDRPYDPLLWDLVIIGEPARLRVHRALQAGQFAHVNPLSFAGSPDPTVPKWSLFCLCACWFESPTVLVWLQLVITLIAGSGMYRLVRSLFTVEFWPACFAAWSYPLTGFFVLWQGYLLDFAVAWLPWMLYGVWLLARAPTPWAWLGLVVVDYQVLTSRLDLAGQALLASGLWAVYWLLSAPDRWRQFAWWRRVAALASAWSVSLMLAAPFAVPLVDYSKTGVRLAKRTSGAEERPPGGLVNASQLIVPDAYGQSRQGSIYLGPSNLMEGASAGYAGLIAALALLPLAFASTPHQRTLLVLAALMIFGCGWVLNLPPLVAFFRLPVINGMSHNRFTFLFGAGVTMASALGWQQLWTRGQEDQRRVRHALIVVVICLLVCAVWGLSRCLVLPMSDQLASLRASLLAGKPVGALRTVADLNVVEGQLRITYLRVLLLCAVGAMLTVGALRMPRWRPYVALLLFALQGGELLYLASGTRPMFDWKFYYPKSAALEGLAAETTQRCLGLGTMPPCMPEMYGFREVRGYDAVDPALLVNLLGTAERKGFHIQPHAVTSFFMPSLRVQGASLLVPPAVNLLAVRYLILREPMPDTLQPVLVADGFYVYENPRAGQRVFVPEQVMTAPEDQILELFQKKQVDTAKYAFLTRALDLPPKMRGTAELVREDFNRIETIARMQTPGLLVLADLWDAGWNATINGRPAEVLCVDTAVRGVVVPAGESTVVFEYRPPRQTLALTLGALGLALLVAVPLGWLWARRKRPLPLSPPAEVPPAMPTS